jgi:mannosyltransferase OCH1-like enzyme
MAGAPGHPFWVLMTESLIPYNWNYLFPYATISYASGQWFHTAIWQQYHASLTSEDKAIHRIMMDDRPGTEPWIFFTQMRGGSWKNWDNVMFLWIGSHLLLLMLGVCTLIGLCGWGVRRILTRRNPRYASISKGENRDV